MTEVSDSMKFKDSDIELFWIDPERFTPRRVPPNCRKALYRKLQILDAACDLRDLRIPPNNRLEKLKGDRRSLTPPAILGISEFLRTTGWRS